MINSFFQLGHREDVIDSADEVGLNDLVIDEENYQRRSCILCNTTLPRSEAVRFTQIEIEKFLIVVEFSKLYFFILIVKTPSFGFHCFHAQLAK